MDPRVLGSGGRLQPDPNSYGPGGVGPAAAAVYGQGSPTMGAAPVAGSVGAYAGAPAPQTSGAAPSGPQLGALIAWRDPNTGDVVPQGTPGAWAQRYDPTVGQFGTNQNYYQNAQEQNQKWSISQDVNYGDYQRLGTQAQGMGAQGAAYLNSPAQQQALNYQNTLAGGPSSGQQAGAQAQGQSIGMLANAAAGNGPTAADIQSQKSISDAMHAQLTAGASARGGAYAQSAAQQTAAANAANIQAQGAGSAAALRAQEQQAAMGQYSQAAQGLSTTQNQAAAEQVSAAQAYQQSVAGQQQLGIGYYQGQQQAYQHQSDLAANLASNQVANNFGLSGTAMQTQTQQNIANQQTGVQIGAAGAAALGGILMAAASTGGAAAGAEGARSGGASRTEAARIGTQIGQQLGYSRLGTAATAFAPADAAAARRGAGMTEQEVHAHLAKLRGLPGPETEPLAPQAYQAGRELARGGYAGR